MDKSLVAKYSQLPGVKSAGQTLTQNGARNLQSHNGPATPGAVPNLAQKYGGANQARGISPNSPGRGR